MANDDEARLTSRGADALLRAIDARFESPIPVQKFIAMLTRDPARAELVDLLLSIVPDRPDAPRWLRWLQGGPAPSLPDDVLDEDGKPRWEDGLRHPRVRKGQSIGRLAEQELKAVSRLDQDIVAADAHAAELRRKRDHRDGVARAAVAYGLFHQLQQQLWGIFALGPAYALMRAVSDRVVGEHALKDNGGPTDAGVTAQVKAQVEAEQVRTVLAALTGDEAFERDLYAAIREVAGRHAGRADKVSEEQRRRLQVLARDNLEEVLEGLALKRGEGQEGVAITELREGDI